MSNDKWLKMLKKHDAVVDHDTSKEYKYLGTRSPAINYLFGKKGGIREGYSALLYGPAKSGKSLISLAFAGELQQRDPEAIVLHFDTEMRSNMATWKEAFGLDLDRFISYSTNDPVKIFDFIAKDVAAMLQEGAPIKMIIIDSLAMISFPKEANAEQSTNHVMGDAAAYLARAFKLILPVIRKYKIYSIMCQHVRSNMDPNSAKYRPYIITGGNALKHSIEYWMLSQKVEKKDAKDFDAEKKDGSGNAIQTGHTIRVKMEENSDGPQNRSVEIMLDYAKGLVNQHLEVTELAVNMGIVERPNNTSYVFEGQKWVGRANFDVAVQEDAELQRKLIEKIIDTDL